MKEKIKFLLSFFTRIVTVILVIDTLVLFIVKGKDVRLSLLDITGILLIGLCCTIFYIPFLTDKPVSKRKMIFLSILYLVEINSVTLLFGHFFKWFCFANIKSFCAFESVIIATYILIMIIFYKIDFSTADKMNEKLKDLEN